MLSQHGLQRLAALLHTGTSLRALRLDFCVGTAFSYSLAAGLGMCTGLTTLSVNHALLDHPWTREYAPRMPFSLRLKTLSLVGNHIDCEAASHLAGALPRCPALAELRLAHNRIRAPGAAVLIPATRACTTLAVLDLSSNELGLAPAAPLSQRTSTVALVVDAVAHATALVRLNLASNFLFDCEQHRIRASWGVARPGLCLAPA
jgi:hypothetical protein